MKTKQPTKKAPVKAGASTSIEDKRQRAMEIKIAREKFESKNGSGHVELLDFVYEYEALGDWKEADRWAMQRLMDHVQNIATSVNRYLNHDCRSLDEAFCVMRPKNYSQVSERKRHLYSRKVRMYGRILKASGAVVDTAFFEVLGEIVGVGKTKASDWYYEVKLPPYKQMMDLPPAFEKYRARLNWKK